MSDGPVPAANGPRHVWDVGADELDVFAFLPVSFIDSRRN